MLMSVILPGIQRKGDRLTAIIAQAVDLGRAPAARAPNRLRSIFLLRPSRSGVPPRELSRLRLEARRLRQRLPE